MGILERLRKKNESTILDTTIEDCPSAVLLLREPVLPTAEQAVEMARSAWGAAGPVELIGSVPPHTYAIRASELYFAIHAVQRRYEASPPVAGEAYQQCWDEHSAWLSVDIPTARSADLRAQQRLGEAYFPLLFFVHKHWSPNCLALYFPAEGVTVPHHGDPVQSIRWARQNGANLEFLKRTKK
jgi:hypothetical protein